MCKLLTGGSFIMGKPSRELKELVVKSVNEGKSYKWIEKHLGVRRGTTHVWYKKSLNGTLHQDGRGKKYAERYDYEFLKKCLALLEEIRSTSHK